MPSIILLCCVTLAAEDSPFITAIRQSQVTILAVSTRANQTVRFRGTVVERRERRMVISTAGHGVADIGGDSFKLFLKIGPNEIPFRIITKTFNPNYRLNKLEYVPGADNAALTIELEPSQTPEALAAISAIKPAAIVPDQTPSPGGRPVAIWVVDQFDRLHALRGGNFNNPKWLEWGPAYAPVPGDSGSGVFVAWPTRGGAIEPRLAGVVIDRAAAGGGASLVTRDSWPNRDDEADPPPKTPQPVSPDGSKNHDM
jgi:hypothetical protein